MEHKGLINTISAIAIIAFMAGLIAFSLDFNSEPTYVLESYPSGAKVYLNEEEIGTTPLTLAPSFFKGRNIDYGKAPIQRLFMHELGGIELMAPKRGQGEPKPQKLTLTFRLPPKSERVPGIFDGAAAPNEAAEGPASVEALMYFGRDNRLTAVFNRDRMPPLGSDMNMRADLSVYSAPGSNVEIPMAEYNSFKLRTSSDFRRRR